MLYQIFESQRSLMEPFADFALAASKLYSNPSSPFQKTPLAQRMSAGYDLIYRLGKDYEKPTFGIQTIPVNGVEVAIHERVELNKPFCELRRFKRFSDDPKTLENLKTQPVVLIVAPLSGHYATLLRDTVRSMLSDHKVYITDWTNARLVPLSEGEFHLDDYVNYVQEFIRHLQAKYGNCHVVSVCQPTVPVLAAVSLMASRGEQTPLSMTMMGGPIDVNHYDYFKNLIKGDDTSTEAHRKFYDEYNAVLDMDADYYLETIQTVFQDYKLVHGTWDVRSPSGKIERVRPQDISQGALLTIEGELDDISGSGQTRAAHDLCSSLPGKEQRHLEAKGAGHYGIFSGRRWRETVYPAVRAFILEHQNASKSKSKAPVAAVPAATAPVAAAPKTVVRKEVSPAKVAVAPKAAAPKVAVTSKAAPRKTVSAQAAASAPVVKAAQVVVAAPKSKKASTSKVTPKARPAILAAVSTDPSAPTTRWAGPASSSTPPVPNVVAAAPAPAVQPELDTAVANTTVTAAPPPVLGKNPARSKAA